jgi:hypothetical protein
MKIYELILPEDEDAQIEEISLVESPAIERNFHSFSAASDRKQTFKQTNDKQIVIGPALIPGMLIPRVDELTGDKYQVFFRANVVERIAHSFNASVNKLFKLEHSEDLSGIQMLESWIITDQVRDKSRAFGFNFPVGTWMVMLKINNTNIWNNFVKTGLVKGFSIGGNFDYIERQRVLASSKNKNKNNNKMTKDKYKDVITKAIEAALTAVSSKFSYDEEEEKEKDEKLAEGTVTVVLPMTEVEFDPTVGFETELEDVDGNKYLLTIAPLATEDPQNADESGAPVESIVDLSNQDEKKKADEEMSKLKAENEKFKQMLAKKTAVKDVKKTAEGFSANKGVDLDGFLASKLKTPIKRK